MKPDAQPPALTPDDERDLAAVGIVASPRRPGRWDDLRGSAPGDRDLTTTAALRRARRDLGVELKGSYYRQAVRNLEAVDRPVTESHGAEQRGFDFGDDAEAEGAPT